MPFASLGIDDYACSPRRTYTSFGRCCPPQNRGLGPKFLSIAFCHLSDGLVSCNLHGKRFGHDPCMKHLFTGERSSFDTTPVRPYW